MKPELLLNASAIKSAKGCTLKLVRILQGYHEQIRWNDTEFGSAGHVGIETYEKTKDADLATLKAMSAFKKASKDPNFKVRNKKDWLTRSYLAAVMEAFYHAREQGEFSEYKPIDTTTQGLLVEKTFKIPFYKGDCVDISLCGTIDSIERIGRDGIYLAADYKFTSQWNIWGFLNGFRLSPQLLFYITALRLLAEKYPDSIFAEIAKARIGGQIRGIFLKSDLSVTCKASDVWQFREEDLEAFRVQLNLLCLNIALYYRDIKDEESTTWSKSGLITNACEGVYGYPCMFLEACSVPERAEKYELKKIPRKEYNPLSFRKEEE